MVSYIMLNSFDDFDSYSKSIDLKGPPVYFYFSGAKTSDGRSWCPDCVEGDYEEFIKFVDNLPEKKHNVYFLFTGKKKENGRSWCMYCQIAEPIVKAYLEEINKGLVFAYVDVGDIKYWRDVNCPFRTDTRLKLMQIPTIIKWKGVKRLEGTQCSKRDLLQLMFEEDDE